MKLILKYLSIIVITATCAQTLAATSVPVTDEDARKQRTTLAKDSNDTIKGVGTKITKSIENQSALLGELVNASTMEVADKIRMAAVVQDKRANAEKYSAAAGAKSMTACGNFGRAKAVREGAVSVKAIYQEFDKVAETHNQRNVFAARGETVAVSNSQRIFNQFHEIRNAQKSNKTLTDGSLVDVANKSLGTEKISGEISAEYTIEAMKINNLVNPFPDNVDRGFNASGQPAIHALANAKALIKQERYRVATDVLNGYAAKRVAVFDPSWTRSMYANNADGSTLNSALTGALHRQGYYAGLEIANRHRATNSDWNRNVGGASNDVGLQKEMVYMQAQMLVNQQETIGLLKDMSTVLAYMYAHQVETSGKSDELSIIK